MFFKDEFYFLSNMYPAEISYEDMTFTCSESLYQAFKCKSKEEMKQFCTLNGYKAKKKGRKICLRDNWDDIKIDVMRLVVSLKFNQHPELMEKLKEIDDDIVEDNDWGDTFWGICNCEGQNNLGKILMEIRDKNFF